MLQALNNPDLVTFGEVLQPQPASRTSLTFACLQILDVPSVAALKRSDDAEEKRIHNLLVLFAYVRARAVSCTFLLTVPRNRYGTYRQYLANSGIYGQLTPPQVRCVVPRSLL